MYIHVPAQTRMIKMMEFEVITETVEATKRDVDLSMWTIELIQPIRDREEEACDET